MRGKKEERKFESSEKVLEKEEKDEIHAYSLSWCLIWEGKKKERKFESREKSIQRGRESWVTNLFSVLKLNKRGKSRKENLRVEKRVLKRKRKLSYTLILCPRV